MESNQNPLFFPTPADFRKWLAENHESMEVLWVGYYKKATKLPSITWPESVAEALCYGWIDGLRKRIDDKSYKIRFTPRKKNSHWSDVNIKMMADLQEKDLVQPAGLAAFERRKEKKSRQAAYEQDQVGLPPNYEEQIKANAAAWAFFDGLAPSYKKATIWYVLSAKREETRLRRLQVLIDSAAEGKKIPQLRRKK